MSKDKNVISNLRYGELHLYYPLKFNTEMPFEKLCETIHNSKISYNEKYEQGIIDAMGASLADTVREFEQKNNTSGINDKGFTITVKNENNQIYNCEEKSETQYELSGDNINLELVITESSFDIKTVSVELEMLHKRNARLESEFEHSDIIYGSSYTSNQKRIILIPLKAQLSNEKIVWINAILIIFQNNMGILKLEIPLIDIDIKPIKENDIDALVKSINSCWKDENISSEIKLSELYKYYLASIFDSCEIVILKLFQEFKNIILVDFNGMPHNINNIPLGIQEELYRIICAPVPDYSFTSYEKEAKEYLEGHSLGKHGIKYIMKSNGGVLSIIDKALFDFKVTNYKKNQNIDSLNDDSYFAVCESIVEDLCNNVEFAILIIMLKKLNEQKKFLEKILRKNELLKIQEEYFQNVLFINELQSVCYGTVVEQTMQMEKMMPLYLRQDINESNQNAIDIIIKGKEQQKNDKLAKFVSIGGLLISIIFALPAIYDSLYILRKVSLGLLKYDIPVITLENASVILWALLIFVILKRIWKDKSETSNT